MFRPISLMKSLSVVSLAIFLLFASLGMAQSPQTSQPPVPAAGQAQQPLPASPPPRPATEPAKPAVSPLDPDEPPKEHRLTAVEARELLAAVDQVLRFVSEDTLLPIKHPVKKAIVSRDEVEKYVSSKLEEDTDRIRFERSELVLKKFGLLPRTFDMHSFMIKLLAEQIAGYYDEKLKTMNLLDWLAPDMQKAVMAHELTHALQDQSYNLEKWSKREDEIQKKGLTDLRTMLRNDEESSCRSAVVEGQGMIVMVDYMLAPTGRSVVDSPKIVDLMLASMEKDKTSPVFDSAPLLLQEELAFPYRYGMNFIKELLVKGGKKLAYSSVLDHMPQTTREIMEPEEYLAGRRVPTLYLPDLDFLKHDYEAYDAGAVGELDVNILLKVYSEEAVAKRLSHDWRGGAYYAAGRKRARPTDKNSTGHIGLYYISKWSTTMAAEEFARIYASALPDRYSRLEHIAAAPAKPGLDRYISADGPIYIQQTGNMVVAVESFDQESAGKLIEAGLNQGHLSELP